MFDDVSCRIYRGLIRREALKLLQGCGKIVSGEKELQSAVDNAENYGGRIVLAPGEYTFKTGVVITENVPLVVDLTGCKITVATGVTGIRVRQGAGHFSRGVVLIGGWFTGGIAVEFNVTDRSQWIGNWRAENCTTAIRLRNDLHPAGTFWTEGCTVADGIVYGCTKGIEFSIDAAAHPSFMETILRNVHFTNNTHGVYIPQDASLVRSNFDHLTFWVRDNQTGIFVDGLIRQSQWRVFFEHSGSANGAQCIDIGSNFVQVDPVVNPQWAYDVQLGRTGSWANIVNDPGSKFAWKHVGT